MPVRHFGITVDDAQAALMFYGFFGFKHQGTVEIPDSKYIANLSNGHWQSALIYKLKDIQGQTLEIIELEAKQNSLPRQQLTQWSHIAFTVDNCAKAVLELESLGGECIGGPVQNPDAPFYVAYIRDPSGNLIEIVEALEPQA